MPRVCTSQPAKVELQGPWSVVLASTTARDREQWLGPAGLRVPWALANISPKLTALGEGHDSLPLGLCLWCRVTVGRADGRV